MSFSGLLGRVGHQLIELGQVVHEVREAWSGRSPVRLDVAALRARVDVLEHTRESPLDPGRVLGERLHDLRLVPRAREALRLPAVPDDRLHALPDRRAHQAAEARAILCDACERRGCKS